MRLSPTSCSGCNARARRWARRSSRRLRSHDKHRHVIEVAVARIVILGQRADDELLRALGLVAAAISCADTTFSGAVDFPALILEPPDQLHSHDLTYHHYLYQFPFLRQKSSLKRKVVK
uniref:Uncharacterized protein n=1 Tax=Glossina palpalis gambiensis TaxID=67801 RepID=A0A1B0B8I0_9MUSC